MSRINRESQISLGKKDIQVNELLKTLIYLPAENVRDFFMELGLTIPREIRMFALREVLRVRVIETRKTRLTLADELNYRLSWFTEFSETQLENLLVFFDDRDLDKDFLNEFWTEVLNYMIQKGVLPESFHHLYEMSLLNVKQKGLSLPSMKTYNKVIKDIFFDSLGRIDGLTLKKIRPVLFKSSTLGEVREIGTKYEVDVPRRLKKNELADIIIAELKDRNKYSQSLESDIRKMSVIVLQRFAIDHDIKASTELKKEEIIEYILKHAKETKEAYFVPQSLDVYEKEVNEVSEEPVEEIVPEITPAPVVETQEEVSVEEEQVVIVEQVDEEVILEEEPVVEEPIEKVQTFVEPQTQPIYQSVDVSELVLEIRKMREVFEKFLLTTETEDEEQSSEEFKYEHISEALPDASEPLVLNSVDFYGNPKAFKKTLKKDEVEEREHFVEQQKAIAKADGSVKSKDEDQPGEVKFMISLGKFLWKVLKVLFKYALILLLIGIVLLFIYAAITRYASLDFLAGFTQTLNGIQIAGKGIIDHIYDLFNLLGI